LAGGVVDGENNRQFAGSYSIRELGINLINPLHQTRCDPGIQWGIRGKMNAIPG